MGKKILIVDDNKLVLTTLKRLLQGAGYETTAANDGLEAVEKIKKAEFDLVITDIRMPGLNGIETIEKIRAFLKDGKRDAVPELVITAYDNEENLKKVEELHVAGFLNKPFDMQELLIAVNKNIKAEKEMQVAIEEVAKTVARAERRRFMRVGLRLPVDIESKSENDVIERIGGLEIINISENGVKIVSDKPIKPVSKIYINLPPCYSDDPTKAKGIEARVKVAWSSPIPKRNKYFYGLYFLEIDTQDIDLLKGIIKYEIEKSAQNGFFVLKPKAEIKREPHSCNMYAIDLTIGCENGCKYCHFSSILQGEWQKKYPSCQDFPIPVDLSPIYEMTTFPESVVYLSPSSDAFAPKARELTHELLEFLLPKGVIFTISTKCIIPNKTIKLLKKYHKLIEGIAMGVTNLSNERNSLLEPNCPPVKERLKNIQDLQEIGCSIGARMDPLFPLVDDTDENLNNTISALAKVGATHISGTYFFGFGKFIKELKQIPLLKESMKLINERSYPIGGVALSAPTDYKKATYEKMNNICKKYGIKFSTCGCKQIGLKAEGYYLICRNLDYYKNQNKKP